MKTVDILFYFRNNRCPIDTSDPGWPISMKLHPSHIQRWIHAVMWHGIRNLILVIPATVRLPSSLCTCKTQEFLLVHMMPVSSSESKSNPSLEVPAKVFLPNLKVLELEDLIFSDADSLNRLVSSCPVIEDLYCCLRFNDCKLNISNPNTCA